MESPEANKPKRQRKKKSRTEVFSESESDGNSVNKTQEKQTPEEASKANAEVDAEPKEMSDTEVRAAFTSYYMQRATAEFAEDLDKIRGADDFKDDALQLLIGALQQGTDGFSIEEQRKVVMDGMEEKKKK